MVEQAVEQKIIDKLEGLKLPEVSIVGMWQSFKDKTVEDVGKGSIVVRVSPAVFDTFGISEITLDCLVVLALRVDRCPDGSELAGFSEAVGEIFKGWNMTIAGDELADLKVPGFSPGGIYFSASSGPDLDRDAAVWSVGWTFQLKGILENTIKQENKANG